MDIKMDIKKVLEMHFAWLNNEPGGNRADLNGADLSEADLRNENLRKPISAGQT